MNLILVNKLEKMLISKGAVVYLTRDGDYDLSSSKINRKRQDLYKRVVLINESDADLYISMHLNSETNTSYRGVQVFYSNVLKDNKIIAKIVTDILKENVKNVRDYKCENSYYMYSKINKPGILIEAGFISNSYDNYLIRDNKYQDKLISSIVHGIENYYKFK